MKCCHEACHREAMEGMVYCNKCCVYPVVHECKGCSGYFTNEEMLKFMITNDIYLKKSPEKKPWWKIW